MYLSVKKKNFDPAPGINSNQVFLNSLLCVWASGAKFIRTSVMFGRAEMYSSLLLVWEVDLHSYWLVWCWEITSIQCKKKIKSDIKYKYNWAWPRVALLMLLGEQRRWGVSTATATSTTTSTSTATTTATSTSLPCFSFPCRCSGQGAWLLEFVNCDVDTFKMLIHW